MPLRAAVAATWEPPVPRRRIVHHPKVIYVHVEQDVHQALRSLTAAKRLTISDVVRDLIHQHLRRTALHPPVGASAPYVEVTGEG